MAYRELGVIELREVWRRYSQGEGLRAIARGLGADRKTIAKIVAAGAAVGLQRGTAVADRGAARATGGALARDARGPSSRAARPAGALPAADPGLAGRRPAADQDPPPTPRAGPRHRLRLAPSL